jgi:hypothetical protein
MIQHALSLLWESDCHKVVFLDDEKMNMSAISMGHNAMFELLKSEESPKQEGTISNKSF